MTGFSWNSLSGPISNVSIGWRERDKSHNENNTMNEQPVLNYLKAREDALLDFLQDLVATPSPTPPGDEPGRG